jgi:FkbM family methyltransferase
MRVVVNLLCCFIPVGKWRRLLRQKAGGNQRRYKRRMGRLKTCGDFQVVEIEGVRVARGNDLNLGHIFDGDGILIVEEIFKNEEYHFDIGRDAVVIDIGMNIGLASLYFAQRDDVTAVYGYEPFGTTYEQALFNFRINEGVARKIYPHNCGLGDTDKMLTLDYYPRTPGRMSTVKTLDEIHPNRKYESRQESVQIRNAAVEIRTVLDRHPGVSCVLKCDAEGAEKEIFESLDAGGILKRIDVILLEYHFSYDMPVMDMLRRNGFVCFKQKTAVLDTGSFGVIRASKQNYI